MISDLYPLKFAPVYKQILWGGDNIQKHFGRRTPFDRVAESWELCCRDDGMGVVAEGPLQGRSFAELIAQYGERLLGENSVAKYGAAFPLLVKLIDANDGLSVQVHPDDAYARLEGEPNGKNELWYIIDAKKDAKLIYGLKETVTKADFQKAVEQGKVAETLNEIPVRPGDSLFIPAGTVHAILDGILIAEIQQNSNTTYRIYDWGRVDANGRGRELHIDKAMNVIRFGALPQGGRGEQTVTHDGYDSRVLLRSPFFNLDEVAVKKEYHGKTVGSFIAAVSLGGSGQLRFDGGTVPVRAGESLLLPASLGEFTFSGGLKLLLASV